MAILKMSGTRSENWTIDGLLAQIKEIISFIKGWLFSFSRGKRCSHLPPPSTVDYFLQPALFGCRLGKKQYLPGEIMLEILVRVPAEDLIRFKRVCKLWFQLISSDPNFSNAHLSHVQEPSIIFTASRVVTDPYWNPFQQHRRYYRLQQQEEMIADEIKLPFKEEETGVHLINSCRGCLLFRSKNTSKELSICNPVTRRFTALPPIPFQARGDYVWALAHDGNYFKVFGISPSKNRNVFLARALVLTLGAKHGHLWRELVPAVTPVLFQLPHTFTTTNGYLHWAAMTASESPPRCIIYSLDIAKEEFTCDVLPSYVPLSCNLLSEVRGSLCLVTNMNMRGKRCYRDAFQVWILDDKPNFQWIQMRHIDITSPSFHKSLGRLGCTSHLQDKACKWHCRVIIRNTSDCVSGLLKVLLHDEDKDRLFFFDFNSHKLKEVAFSGIAGILDVPAYHYHFNSLIHWL